MQPKTFRRYVSAALPITATWLLLGSTAHADEQTADDDWQFRASLYGYLPNIGGETSFPAGANSEIDVSMDDLLDNVKFAGMASFEAQKNRWGAFADFIYMNIGRSVSDTQSLGAGGAALPPGITADASLDVKAWALTLAANYRAIETSTSTFDVFAGARMLDAKGDLDWEFNVDLSPFGGPPRTGSASADGDSIDAIAGIKGRYSFGTDGHWFIPYYLDAGTGDADLTWQAAIGIGYATRHFDAFAAYRHLDYDLGSDARLESLEFDGPAIGIAYRW